MKLVNLTPHAITIRASWGDTTFPPSGRIARVNMEEIEDDPVMGFPSVKRVSGKAFIPLEAGEIGIVSSMVLAAAKDDELVLGYRNTNLIAPDTGPTAIRENGQVIAVIRFVRN
jgi:hypothetical protein